MGSICSPSEVTRRDLSPLSKPTGLTEYATNGQSGCLMTACISTRRGVRTTHSSTNRPLSRAAARRSCLSSNRTCGTPFTASLHHFSLRFFLSPGALSIARPAFTTSIDFHQCRGLKRGNPRLLGRILTPLIEGLNSPVETAQRAAPHPYTQALPLGRALRTSVNIARRSQ